MAQMRRPKFAGMTHRARRATHELFEQHVHEALDTLLGVMRDDEAPPADRIKAAREIIGRARGAIPSYTVVEADIAHRHTIGVDQQKLADMSDEELRALEQALARVAARPQMIEVSE